MNNKRVLVVSFFPGNDSPSVVGGFDWIYEDSPAASEWLKGEIDSLASQAGDISFTVVRMMVPVDLDNDEVTNYISRRDEYRELPEQCSDDPGVAPVGGIENSAIFLEFSLRPVERGATPFATGWSLVHRKSCNQG